MENSVVRIKTNRFFLRTLTEGDATEQYVNWLNEQSNAGYIISAKQKNDINQVRQYIKEREANEDVLFLGIFTKDTATHIGNIKYEPIDLNNKSAVMGIMIGEPLWQGKNVACEVITESAKWLKNELHISKILLGVDSKNHAAIRAYEKAGFMVQENDEVSPDTEVAISMVLNLKSQ